MSTALPLPPGLDINRNPYAEGGPMYGWMPPSKVRINRKQSQPKQYNPLQEMMEILTSSSFGGRVLGAQRGMGGGRFTGMGPQAGQFHTGITSGPSMAPAEIEAHADRMGGVQSGGGQTLMGNPLTRGQTNEVNQIRQAFASRGGANNEVQFRDMANQGESQLALDQGKAQSQAGLGHMGFLLGRQGSNMQQQMAMQQFLQSLLSSLFGTI